MQYWLGANERTRVLPTDKWYLDFATSILPLVKASPLFNKEELRTQIDAAISLGMYFQDAIAQSGGWKLFSEAFQGVYGTYLPFYPLSDDYTPDEINQEDIAFVLWTLKSQFSIFDKEYTLFSPYDKDLLALSQQRYKRKESVLGRFLKFFFAYSTQGANPIFGKVFERCSRFYSIFRVAQFRVIDIIAYSANVLFHKFLF